MRKVIFYFLTFIIIVLAGLWLLLHSEMFWSWAGQKIINNLNDSFKGELAADPVAATLPDGYVIQYAQVVETINKNIRGKLTVDAIEGTPFSGYVFKGVHLITPQGEIFHAKAFMLRLSLWSILELNPNIEKMALYNPVLTLEQDEQGQWNINRLYQPREGSSSIFSYFNSLNFAHILIDHGQVEVRQPGGPEMFQDINLNASLKILKPITSLRARGAV